MSTGSGESQSRFKDQVITLLEGILEIGGSVVLGVSSRFAPGAQSLPGFALWQVGMVEIMSAAAGQFAEHQRHLLVLVDSLANQSVQEALDHVDQLRRAGISLSQDVARFEATPEQAATLLQAYTDVAFWSKKHFGRPIPEGIYQLFLTTLEPPSWARDELLAANRPGGPRLSAERLKAIVAAIKPLTHATLTVLAMTATLQDYLRQLGVIYQDDRQ